MKSEAFFAAIPPRATCTVPEEPRRTSQGIRIVPIACFVITLVCGGIGLSWGKISMASLSFQTEKQRLEETNSLLEERRQPIFDLRVSHRADYLSFRTISGEVVCLDISETSGDSVQQDLFPGRFCEELQFSPVANQMAVIFADGEVLLQSLDSSEPSRILYERGSEAVDSLSYSPDGRLLAGISSEGLIIVWNIETGSRITRISRSNDAVSSVAFDSELGLLLCFESGLEHWLIDPNQTSGDGYLLDWKLPGHYTASEMVVSPDGNYLMTASFVGTFGVLDLVKRENLWELKGLAPSVRGLTPSRDSQSFYCFSAEKEFVKYDALTGEDLAGCYDSRMKSGTGGGCSPQGDVIYTGSSDGFIRIWSANDEVMIGKIDTARL